MINQNKPLKEFPKLILAPLSEITVLSFRLIARSLGAELTILPLISSYAIVYNNEKTMKLILETEKEPRPRAIQIFGDNEEIIKKAVKIIDSLDIFDIVDLNAGCPSRKIIKSGSGGALLKEPNKLRRILKTIKENTKALVTVKVRLGFSENTIDEIIKAVDKYVDAIAIHGRTIKQSFSGKNDWESIFRATKLTNKHIIGNGDIRTKEDYLKVKDKVYGVMIGRAALTNPGLFSEIKYDKNIPKNIIIKKLIELEYDFINLKKLSLFIVSGLKNSHRIKQRINTIKNKEDLISYLTFLAKEIKPE